MYSFFTAAFNSSLVAGSTRSIGFTNRNDGFLLLDDAGTMKLRHIRSNGATVSDVARTSWTDKLDGTGASGLNIDLTKTNIFMVTLGHLGVAPVRFWIHDGAKFVEFYKFTFANLQTALHLVNPYLKIIAKVTNTSNTAAATLLTGSWNAGSIHGTRVDESILDRRFNKEVTVSATSTETPFFTIRNKTAYPTGSLENLVQCLPLAMRGATDGNGTNDIKFRIYRDATLSAGTTTFADYDNTNSCVDLNTAATAITGGTQIFYAVSARNMAFEFKLIEDLLLFYPGQQLTVTVQTATAATANFSFVWREEH